MSRIIFVLSILLFSANLINAQSKEIRAVKKGDLQLSAGIGIIPTYAADGGHINVPPVSAKLTYQLSEKFSLGAYAAFSSTTSQQLNYPDGSTRVYDSKQLIFGTRAAAHINRFKNWDVYGGLMLGYSIPTVDQITQYPIENDRDDELPSFSRPAESKFLYSGFIGATYFFSPQLGVYGEVGYGISLLNLGVNYKF
ncbi:MAG: hypothetical protein DHS20C18_34350 [Saprospiraceae bacterium]|nr:MAG: hypothetical protein DHS20C18_34350 [Saprospiraceae bacterium]